MGVKLSAHTNVTNPEQMGFPYLESIKSYANVCDEVVVVDGGSTDGSLEKIAKIPRVRIVKGLKWDYDFDWTILPKNLQIGYEVCKGDWAFKFDVDYIFHEKFAKQLKEEIAKTDLPAIEMAKCNFTKVDRYFVKDYYPFLVYKKRYPIICYGVGKEVGDKMGASFLSPIQKNSERKDGLKIGEFVRMSNCRVHRCDIEIYCYDFSFMVREQVKENRERFEVSLAGFLGTNKKKAAKKSWSKFRRMMNYRYKRKDNKIIKLEDHSKFIRERVKNIKPTQFGCNMYGDSTK